MTADLSGKKRKNGFHVNPSPMHSKRIGYTESVHCAKYPAGNHIFKVNHRNTRARCEICSKLTIKTPERHHWRRSGVFIVNFEHISHLVLVFLLLILSR